MSFDAAISGSTSGSTTMGELLPNSRDTFLCGAVARMFQPTGGEPVKVIMATSPCSTRWAAVLPGQVTTFSQPDGRPHSSSNTSARRMAVSGVAEAGLSTTGQPAAIAGATLWQTRLRGKLNGEMAPTTPIGTFFTKAVLPAPAELASGVSASLVMVRATAAEKRAVSIAREASTRAVAMGLAASSEMLCANSS